jgi:hypothetical protein
MFSKKVKLDRERTIQYTMHAFMLCRDELIEKTGEQWTTSRILEHIAELGQAANKSGGAMDFEDLRFILWVGLKQDDESLTLEDTGKIIDLKAMQDIGNIMIEMYGDSFPEPSEETKKKSQKKPAIKKNKLNQKPKKKKIKPS